MCADYQYQPEGDVVYGEQVFKPKIIGRYMPGDRMGEGSYSLVKVALDTVTLELRAMKIMKRHRLRRIPNGELNVRKEIELLRRLNHKNVIKLIETINRPEKEKLYIVMEFCYMVLQELIEHAPMGRFPPWQTHGYFTQLLDGIEYLHSQGVVHNDIKPGNLLVNSMNVLKIIDFGVSQLLDQYENSDYCEHSQGTPAFQAPEIAQGYDKYHGFKVDAWAAGVTLYKFSTGNYPFVGANVYILLETISKADLKIPSYIEENLQSLMRGMLTRDADERFSIADAKNHYWVRKTHPKSGSDEVKWCDIKSPPHPSVEPYVNAYYKRNEHDIAPADANEIVPQQVFHQREIWRYTKLTPNLLPEVIEQAAINENQRVASLLSLHREERMARSRSHVRERCNQN